MTAHLRAQRLDRGADAGDQSAAADRHDDRVEIGRLLQDLERHRALARDHVGVVERMDEGEVVAARRAPRRGRGFAEVGAVQHHVGAELRGSW